MRACLSSALPGRAHPCFDALCPSPHLGLPHLGVAAAPSLVPSACLGLSSPLPKRHGLCLGSLVLSSLPAWVSPRLCSHGLSRHWSCRPQTPLPGIPRHLSLASPRCACASPLLSHLDAPGTLLPLPFCSDLGQTSVQLCSFP